MKNRIQEILGIFFWDIHQVATNIWAAAIVMGIVLIPALYAWFNINSNWDPYAATRGLKIAVANLDTGADIEGMPLNVGDMLVAKLAVNDAIGWQFVSQEQARQGVKDGSYYAAIIIPEDFSASIGSIAQLVIEKPRLQYIENEKKNAIASKITSTGMNTVQTEINETIVQTAASVLSTLGQEASRQAQSKGKDVAQELSDALLEMDSSLDTYVHLTKAMSAAVSSLQSSLESARDLLPAMDALMEDATGAASDARSLLEEAHGSSQDLSQSLDAALQAGQTLSSTAIGSVQEGIRLLEPGTEEAAQRGMEQLDHAQVLLENLRQHQERMIQIVQDLKNAGGDRFAFFQTLLDQMLKTQNAIEDLQSRTERADTTLQKTDALRTQTIADLDASIENVQTSFDEVQSVFTKEIKPEIQSMYQSLDALLSRISQLSPVDASLQASAGASAQDLEDALSSGKDALDETTLILEDIQSKLHQYVKEVEDAKQSEKIQKLEELLDRDPALVAAFMKEPVAIETETIYPIANYGSGMAPFYTTLAIWVGALVNCAIIKVKVKKTPSTEMSSIPVQDQPASLPTADQKMEAKESDQSQMLLSAQLQKAAQPKAPGKEAAVQKPAQKERACKKSAWLPKLSWKETVDDVHPDVAYFGRYLFFALISLLQALVICLGDLYLLKIQCLHPMLFCLMGLVAALSYSLLMYTLTVSFGDVGKAIAVIIMVIQVAGSGGTYPIEILPKFYQMLYPWFPFTYSINGMRECIAGMYGQAFWVDVALELCFVPFSLFLGLVLRKPIIRLKDYIEKRVESTGFLG